MCIDIGHKCNINCMHCYHKHEPNRDARPFKIKQDILLEVEHGYYRGNDYIDFTGGETTICSDLPAIIQEASLKFDMKSCIITNALCGMNTLDHFIAAGTDDFLISLHGMEKNNDAFMQRPGARGQQIKFIEHLLANGKSFRANYCITSFNQGDLLDFADWIITFKNCKIVNFINFNPHHGWSKDDEGTKAIIADLSKVEIALNQVIPIIEAAGIGVNLRYYPMCRVDEKYRRCVCNDLHVTFDPYEWDYEIDPKTPEKHLEWGIGASNRIEMKEHACGKCRLQWVCGGVNRAFYRAAGKDCVNAISEEIAEPFNNYFYRRNNTMTLKDPRQS